MPTILRFLDMRIQIYTNEPTGEMPHVHVKIGKGPGRASIKVLLGDDPEIVKLKGHFPGSKMDMALRTIRANKDALLAEWTKLHGETKPRG